MTNKIDALGHQSKTYPESPTKKIKLSESNEKVNELSKKELQLIQYQPTSQLQHIALSPKPTINDIYGKQNLDGSEPQHLTFSPNGECVTFLKGKRENPRQMDLWEYHIPSRKTRLLVDSKDLIKGEEKLSDEEKAIRERKRQFVNGIVSYFWSHDGKALLFPLNGNLYYHDLTKTRQITKTDGARIDVRFSPKSRFVSFVQDKNIYVIDVKTGNEKQLTFDGKDLISNGVAEFIAQEELDRFTGYWWSPDERYIAFTQVDESPVRVLERMEIYGDEFKTYKQRYPLAGTPNAKIKIGIIDLQTGKIKWSNMDENADIYLTRVNWLPDSKRFAIQILSRDQKKLQLKIVDVDNGTLRSAITEEKRNSWINVFESHNIYFLENSPEFIWLSEHTGYRHLYQVNLEDFTHTALTAGDWMVNSLLGVDEEKELVYFDGYAKTPLEKHLYFTRLNTNQPHYVEQITKSEGWHDIEMSANCQFYTDTFSNPITPPQVSLHSSDGKRITFIEENKLDKSHPYSTFIRRHSAPEFGSVKASDGQTLYYRMIKPVPFDPNKKYPVILNVYGGPHVQLVKKQWLNMYNNGWTQVMANKGYVIFTLDNRGSGERGKKFEDPIYRRFGKVEVEDQKTGIDYLKTLPFIDGDRIGVFGWSYGGYMTLMMLMQEPETFQTGFSVAPVTDWGLYDTCYTERYLGKPDENKEDYKQSSVFSHVKKDMKMGSLYLVHGMADDNVFFTNTTKLMKSFQDKGVLFETMTYPGHKHSIASPEARTHLFKTMINFFDRKFKKR